METVHAAPSARLQPPPTVLIQAWDSSTSRGGITTAPGTVGTAAGTFKPLTSHGCCNAMRNTPSLQSSPNSNRKPRCRLATVASLSQQGDWPQPCCTSAEHSAFMRAWDQRIRSSVGRPSPAPGRAHGNSNQLTKQANSEHRAAAASTRWLPVSLCHTSSRLQQQLMQSAAGLPLHPSHTIREPLHWRPGTTPGVPILLRRPLPADPAGTVAVPLGTPPQQQWSLQPAAAHSQPWVGGCRPASAEHHRCLQANAAINSVYLEAGGSAAAAADERMFSRWQTIREAQQAAAAALVNQTTWTADASASPSDWQLVPAGEHAADVSRAAAAAAADVVLAHASQLLEKCTVLSSKKQAEPCCICLDDIAVNALVPLLRCGHRIHRACLLKWLTQQMNFSVEQPAPQLQQAVVCPMCKQVSVDRQLLCAVGPAV